jgi:acylphosphatase
MSKICRHLRLYGRVQGVWFRGSMARKASELKVAGWVRNRFDGTVEAVVEGSPDAVEAIIAWAKRGPRGAIVERAEVTEATGDYAEFRMLPTE